MAFCGVGAVDLVPADVKRCLVEPKVGEQKVVRQLVLVGEYEVIESSFARLQCHLKSVKDKHIHTAWLKSQKLKPFRGILGTPIVPCSPCSAVKCSTSGECISWTRAFIPLGKLRSLAYSPTFGSGATGNRQPDRPRDVANSFA